LATLFVVINLVGQLGSVAMVLTRFKVDIACCVLFFIVVLQVCSNYDDKGSVVDPDPYWIQIQWGPWQCCGSGVFLPDPKSRISFYRIMFFLPLPIPDPGVKKAPNPGSAIPVSRHGSDSHLSQNLDPDLT
jgi:hypothetical protein